MAAFRCPLTLKRGKSFNTLIVDLEHHRPVDIVDDRTAEPVIAWLMQHPGARVISRDRSQAYANAARSAAPDAVQVADRFHLVRNVYDALKTLARSRTWEIPEQGGEHVGSLGGRSTRSGDSNVAREPGIGPTTWKEALWEAVRQYNGKGMGIRAIARELGIHRETVRKYVAADSPPRYVRHAHRRTKVTPFLPYMQERWDAGCHNAKTLYSEIREKGYSGRYTQVKDAVRPWRSSDRRTTTAKQIELWPLLLPSQDKLDADQRQELDRVLAVNPVLDRAYRLKEEFLRLIRERSAAGLDGWLADADGSGIKQFVALSRSFRSDYEAIRAGLSLRWSTAQCEGQITRVKLIKRQGYGRAKPDLLRQRVLHRSVA